MGNKHKANSNGLRRYWSTLKPEERAARGAKQSEALKRSWAIRKGSGLGWIKHHNGKNTGGQKQSNLYRCMVCSKTFLTAIQLRKHRVVEHPIGKGFEEPDEVAHLRMSDRLRAIAQALYNEADRLDSVAAAIK